MFPEADYACFAFIYEKAIYGNFRFPIKKVPREKYPQDLLTNQKYNYL